ASEGAGERARAPDGGVMDAAPEDGSAGCGNVRTVVESRTTGRIAVAPVISVACGSVFRIDERSLRNSATDSYRFGGAFSIDFSTARSSDGGTSGLVLETGSGFSLRILNRTVEMCSPRNGFCPVRSS